MSVRIAVFASGGGSNLQALIDRFARDPAGRIALVVSDRAAAGALERARNAGIDTVHIPFAGNGDDVAATMLHELGTRGIALIVLAGYLRLVPAAVITRFAPRILNIHPALLPSFGGPGMYGSRVHAAVIAAGSCVSGATVHRVNERYDEGSIVAQWPVPVWRDDTAESLAARVLRIEHILLPAVVAAEVRAMMADGAVLAGGRANLEFRLAPEDAVATVAAEMMAVTRTRE